MNFPGLTSSLAFGQECSNFATFPLRRETFMNLGSEDAMLTNEFCVCASVTFSSFVRHFNSHGSLTCIRERVQKIMEKIDNVFGCAAPSSQSEAHTQIRDAATASARLTSPFRPHRDNTSVRKRSPSAMSCSRTALAKPKPSAASGGKAACSPDKIARKVGGFTPSRSAIVTTN
jgi:hypothetical protein